MNTVTPAPGYENVSSGKTAFNAPTGELTVNNLFAANNKISSAKMSNIYEEWQADTAHQREVADFKAAGINPLFTAQSNGASTFSPTIERSASGGGSGFGSDADTGSLFGNLIMTFASKALGSKGAAYLDTVLSDPEFQTAVDNKVDELVGYRPFGTEAAAAPDDGRSFSDSTVGTVYEAVKRGVVALVTGNQPNSAVSSAKKFEKQYKVNAWNHFKARAYRHGGLHYDRYGAPYYMDSSGPVYLEA